MYYDSFLNVFTAELSKYQIDKLEAKDTKNIFGSMKNTVAGMGRPAEGGGNINK